MTTHVQELARIRSELVGAVARDRARAARRRRAGLAAVLVVAAAAAVGSAIAAATGAFSPAPAEVQQTIANEGAGAGVDAAKAVRIGVIDDHAAYAAPTADGGFCLYFASNPRSGPGGSRCFPGAVPPGQLALNVSVGTDGGFAFGRIANGDAVSVDVHVPNGGGTVGAPVVDDGFFLATLSERALRALTIVVPAGPKGPPSKDGGPIRSFDQARLDAISATARDARGRIVARGVNTALPDPGMPTDTSGALPAVPAPSTG